MTTDIEATSTKSLAALIVDDELTVTVGGLTLTERAVLLAHRAGLSPLRVWGVRALDPASVERLRQRGVAVVQQPPDLAPLERTPDNEGVVVIGPGVLFGSEVLTVLTGGTGEAAAIYDAGAAPQLLYLSSGAKGGVRTCRSIETMIGSLSMRGALTASSPGGAFCRRVDRANVAAAAERDYVRHLNGTGESYFTKKIRRFSVPLTSRLVRLGARPSHVTLGGLALAAASAWSMAQGSYVAGVLGAALYYASMILDCSDGEVARLTMRDSPFGAWLETMVDYLTYFLMLGALTAASQNRPGADAYRIAASIALVGSIVVALVAGYLRHRVAAADPGQFDDASAQVLASSSRFHRFARWGRQWIKRSTLAHLVVVLALVNQLPALLFLWAFGATVASVVILAVEPFVVRRVAVSPARVRKADAGA